MPWTTAKWYPVKKRDTWMLSIIYSFHYFSPAVFHFSWLSSILRVVSLSLILSLYIVDNRLRQPDLDPPASVIHPVRKSLWDKTHRETNAHTTSPRIVWPMTSDMCTTEMTDKIRFQMQEEWKNERQSTSDKANENLVSKGLICHVIVYSRCVQFCNALTSIFNQRNLESSS